MPGSIWISKADRVPPIKFMRSADAADGLYRPAVAAFNNRVSKDQYDAYHPVAYEFDTSASKEKFAGLSFWDYDIGS